MDLQFDDAQQAAIDRAVEERFLMITGGAGTGKTTIIKEISERLKDKGKNVALCAFAGKAAARLQEATGFSASTIHRLLKYDGNLYNLKSLEGTIIVIDEASMVASDLMAEVVRRKPAGLILVGDPSQLPPVGRGQPFHDLLRYKPRLESHLSTCYRNSEAVYKAATAIRHGEIPLDTDRSENEKWDVVRTGGPKRTHEVILEYVRQGYIDFEQDIILTPRNGDNDQQPATVKGLNADIVAIVNPRQHDKEIFRPGDRVINTKNYAEHDVWNGTTGTIDSIDMEGEITVRLDTPIVDYERSGDGDTKYKFDVVFDTDMRKSLQLAYALTVHKSQGSQYRRVIFVCLKRDSFCLLDRSLIYTAVTRTREQCVVMGDYGAFCEGIRTEKQKRTVIQELAGAL